MSNPQDRLLTDRAAENLQLEALAVLSAPLISSQSENLAAAVVALARDRQARVELATLGQRERAS